MSNATIFTLDFLKLYFLRDKSLDLLRSENTNNLYAMKNKTWFNLNYDDGDLAKYEKKSAAFDLKRLRHVFSIADHRDLLLATAPQGVRMFLCEDHDVSNVNSGEHFLASEWKEGKSEIIFGRFYDDVSKMGAILIQTGLKNVKFLEIQAQAEGKFKFHDISTYTNGLERFCPNISEIFLVNIMRGAKEEVVGRYESGFCVFEFGLSSELRFVRIINYIANNERSKAEEDKFFFANLSGHDFWMDLIVFNSSGMFVFDYRRKSTNSYALLNYNPMFSEEYGWRKAHTDTVHFVDIDGDGFDDLVFTGPEGIEILSYDLYLNKWRSVLRTDGLSVQERHSIVLNAVPVGNTVALLTYHSESHHFANIIARPAEMLIMARWPHRKFPVVMNRTAIIPEVETKAVAKSRSIVYLRDLKFWFGKWESINPQTGRPYFMLPLVTGIDPMIKFNLFYDGSSNINESLGYGWSTEQNFIALNYPTGNFKENHRYTIVIDNIPYELTPLPTNSTNYELFDFGLKPGRQTENLRVKYYPSTSTWYIDNELGRKQYYGCLYGQFGAVGKDTAWLNWRGPGLDKEHTIEWSNIWYLALSEIVGIATYYEYELENNNGKIVHLKSIQNPASELTFAYNKNYLLSNYTYKTKTIEQTVHLKYTETIDNISLLTSIEQESDYMLQPVVQFKYCEPKQGSRALERIILPTGTEVVYSYTLVGEPVPLDGGYRQSIEVSDDYNVNYGPGFVLISYIDTESKQVRLRMFNDEMSEEIFPSNKSRWPSIGLDVDAYETLTGDSFFAVVTYTLPTKTICLFGRGEDNSWATELCSDHSDESEMLKGTNYVLISDPNNANVVLIQWSAIECTWETLRLPFGDGYHRAVAVFGTKFVVYNDTAITLAYKNAVEEKGWIYKRLEYATGYLSETIETISKFDLKHDFEKALLGFFRSNAIHISHNLIALTSLAIEGDERLVTKIRTYVVDQNHEVFRKDYKFVDQDNFFDLHSGEETSSKGDKYTLKYAYKNSTFQLVLGHVTLSKSPIAWLMEQIADQMNSPAQRFLLDLRNYHVSLRDQTLQCRQDRFVFGGNKWHWSDVEKNSRFTSLPLGDRFTMNKTDARSTIKLYDATSKQILFDFRVKEIEKLQINYPNYIASQEGDEALTILEFVDIKNNRFRTSKLLNSKKLSLSSNAQYLVALETNNEGKRTLLFWPKFDVRRFLPNYVVDSINFVIPDGIYGGSRNRITGYEYHESSPELVIDTIYYNRSIVIPGNNRQLHGHFSMSAETVEFFNGDNQLVKTIANSNYDEALSDYISEPVQEDFKLYSSCGLYEIANFAPFPIGSDMTSFIGFENYEFWNFDESWTFNKTNIVRGDFALTGKNYLHLESMAMKGTFRPDFQDQQFLASCWIRTSIGELLIPGDTVPYLTASVLSSFDRKEIFNFMAGVKRQIGDWSYLEVVVDLKFTDLVLKTANQTTSKYFEIEIRVSPFPNQPIDVDHVRFSPLNKIFEINVYDDETNNLIAVIKQNGAITRKVYDKYRVQIAEINESNQIEKFTTYTKASSFVGHFAENPPCLITIDPENGFYDDFSPMSFRTHWELTDNKTWNISPSSLQHRNTSTESQMLFKSMDIDWKSYGVRFLYSLKSESSILISQCVGIIFDTSKASIFLIDGKSSKRPIPVEGEILFVTQKPRVFVWIDGGLYIDQYSSCAEPLAFSVKGEVKLQHLMMFERPGLQVTYKNALNEDIQQITLTSSASAVIRQLLYDDLGRQRITLLPFDIHRIGKDSLMAYDAGVVTNDNPDTMDSVWKTGIIEGGARRVFGHDYPFAETVYDNSPLNVRVRIGLPGREFSAYGFYGRKFKSMPLNQFLRKMYPMERNFSYEVQSGPSGNDEDEKVIVFDERNRKVASYIHVKNGQDSFASFEYNERGLMIKCRSPMYYLKFGIFNRTSLDLIGFSNQIPERHPLEIHIEYDDKDNLLRKFNPDTGPIKNINNDDGQIRFIIQYLRDSPKKMEFVTYFLYDTMGRLSSSGRLKNLPENGKELLKLNVTEENADEFQRFYFSNTDRDPALRGKILRTVTINQGQALFEESIFESNLISKRYILSNGVDDPLMWSITKEFEGGLLKRIAYPASMFGEVLQVTYEYDKLGRMVFVEIPGQLNRIMLITYDASNRVTNEFFHPLNNPKFHRIYTYNAAGYLVEVNDPFLSEEISYIDKAYGRNGYGDGTITRVKFIAKWHEVASTNGIGAVHSDSFECNGINSTESEQCYRELKQKGYLNADNHQTRIFYQNLDPLLSLACTNNGMERRVKQVLGTRGFPREYGFRLDYGKYMELKKAKYFVGNTSQEKEAFQQDSFMRNIDSIDREQSQNIWNLLKTKGYIVEDGDSNIMFGRSIVRTSLADDLKSVQPEFGKYAPLVIKLLIRQFTSRQSDIAISELEQIFVPDFPNKTACATAIHGILSNQDYLRNPFDENFVGTLTGFHSILPEIVDVMQKNLGADRTEFDVDVNQVDLNGNRIRFQTGFDKYRLQYEPDSNRISYVLHSNSVDGKGESAFKVRHDSRGNVIQALHLNIDSMEYHAVSNRLLKVHMTSGTTVTFGYDSKGERFHKRVANDEGKTNYEIYYLRDENGRIIVERNLTYVAENQKPDVLVTMYIYGPKSLVGFVRRDQFYKVIVDHQGSSRLIVRDGEVVAAYDYLPYGKLMRSYESTPLTRISYLYTGQEWDPETGLYNYHARFYDPSIGRFYQIDPMSQYFSPYKYAGNSPISMVDPTGSVGFLFMLTIFGFALLCAYVEGSRSNNDYNILNWKWNQKTHVALMRGAIVGALIPIGFKASVGVIAALKLKSIAAASLTASIGVSVSYIKISASSGEWNPINWDHTSPKTLSDGLVGFSAGVNIYSVKNVPYARIIRLLNHAKFALPRIENSISDENLKKPGFGLSSVQTFDFPVDFPIFNSEYNFKQNNGGESYLDFPNMEHKNLKIINDPHSAVLIQNMNLLFRDTYYNFVSVGILRSDSLDSINLTISRLTDWTPVATSSEHLQYTLRAKTLDIATEVANVLRNTRKSEYWFALSNQILSLQFHNVTIIYTENRFTNPVFFINNNGTIGHDPVTQQTNPAVNQMVANAIVNAKEMLSKSNDQSFFKLNIMKKRFVQSLDDNSIAKCEKTLEKLFEANHTHISRDIIIATMKSLNFPNQGSRTLKRKYLKQEQKLKSTQKKLLNKSLSFTQKFELAKKSQSLDIFIKNLKSRERVSNIRHIDTLADIIWKVLKEHQISYIGDPSSTIFPNSMASSVKYIPNPTTYDSTQDVISQGSELTAFKKCYTCIEMPPLRGSQIQDFVWLNLLDDNFREKFTIARAGENRKIKRRSTDGVSEKINSFEKQEGTFPKTSNFLRKLLRKFQSIWSMPSDPIFDDGTSNDFSPPYPLCNESCSKSAGNITDFGDKLLSQMATNETLLLAGLLAAKCGKQKLYRPTQAQQRDGRLVYPQIQVFACEVIEMLENCVRISANAAGIASDLLDMSEYPELYRKVISFASANKFEDIFNLLMKSAMKALPLSNKDEPNSLIRTQKRKKFEKYFNQLNVKSKFDEILVKMNRLTDDFD